MKYITTFFFLLVLSFSAQSKNKLEKFVTDYSNSILKIRYNYSQSFTFSPTYYESSGFALGDGSLIVTALKNLPKAEAISIYKANDSVPTPAWVIATDTLRNLCLLKTENPTFEPIKLTEEPIRQAQDIVLIGWLADRMKTSNYVITEGIVSSSIRDTVVQTSAPLNYGMEGGAALNMDGKLIGLITGKDKPEYEKTGFFVRNEFINSLIDSSNSETYQLDTNDTDYQYHENLSAYKKFAEAATKIYKDLEPRDASEIEEGLEEYISLNEKSESFEKNPRTYFNLAYAHLLKIYVDAVELNGGDISQYSTLYSNYLNDAYELADSNYQERIKYASLNASVFFKLKRSGDEKFNYYDFYTDYFRRSWEYFIEQYDEKEERSKDFNQWLNYGTTPRELDDAIGAFKNKRRSVGLQERTRLESIGSFWLPGPITISNSTELMTDPYRDNKNVIPISNYFLVGYSIGGYGIRLGFQNYQRPLPSILLEEEEIESDAYRNEQSLIIGLTMYGIFEANFYLTSDKLYYSKLIDFNMVLNRPNDIDGLTDYYITMGVSVLGGVNTVSYSNEVYLSDEETSMFGIGLGIRFYKNYYFLSKLSLTDNPNNIKTLNLGLEAYY
ncbi:MAG: serine protease [Chlorobiota bacterium]